MTALEFLNILSYRRDKQAEEREQTERWKKLH